MAKRFSLIDLGEIQLVKSGFIEPDSLLEIQEFLELAEETSSYAQMCITILHLLFLDFEGAETTDTTEEEVEILKEKLSDFYDYGCIVTVEEIEIEGLYGVKEEEIIETVL